MAVGARRDARVKWLEGDGCIRVERLRTRISGSVSKRIPNSKAASRFGPQRSSHVSWINSHLRHSTEHAELARSPPKDDHTCRGLSGRSRTLSQGLRPRAWPDQCSE